MHNKDDFSALKREDLLLKIIYTDRAAEVHAGTRLKKQLLSRSDTCRLLSLRGLNIIHTPHLKGW